MTPTRIVLLTAILTVGSAVALADEAKPQAPAPAPKTEAKAAAPAAAPAATADEHAQVQHILIGFTGSVPGKNITRTKEEAKKLADDVLARAKKGEDFEALVKQYTDDSPPGIYGLSNKGITPAPGEFARERMVPAFGNVGFSLKPGEIGLAEYDPKTSPYGWHIIKRLK